MKRELRQMIEAARKKEESDFVPHADDPASATHGHWTAKDQLAHLAAWREMGAAELDAIRTGQQNPAVTEDLQAHNDRVYEESRDLPSDSILGACTRSWDAFAAALEASSEEDLVKPRIRHSQVQAWQLIPGHTLHVGEHLSYWHADKGDMSAAEEAANWSYQHALDSGVGDPLRGTAEYSLGCFYALRGRAADATAHFEIAFKLDPSLREWAKIDTDLDPIRSTPEVVRLLT